MLLSGPSVSDLQPCFCLFIVGACFFFCPMKEIFLGLQFTHLSLPGQVSQPWQLMLGGLGLCPQGCHWGQ